MTALTKIPDIVIERLPLYLRALSQLMQEGQTITSSHELGQRLGISSAQIRKDLSHFGEFGKQGTGYQIQNLQTQLKQILQINREWSMIVVGAGDLGRAIANYGGFVERGFRVVGIFDSDPHKIGMGSATINGATNVELNALPVRDVAEAGAFVREHQIKIAMLAVPSNAAQPVCDKLVEAGIRAIVNYAPISLNVPANVRVEYIDPVMHLQHMTYYLD